MACQCRALVDRNSSNALNELPSKKREVELELEDIGDGDHKAQSTITTPPECIYINSASARVKRLIIGYVDASLKEYADV